MSEAIDIIGRFRKIMNLIVCAINLVVMDHLLSLSFNEPSAVIDHLFSLSVNEHLVVTDHSFSLSVNGHLVVIDHLIFAQFE